MDFTFTPEQQELRRAIRELAADRSTPAHVRRVMDAGSVMDDELWRILARDMGLLGLGVGDERGGAGGSFVDAAVVIEEAGRALMPAPLLPTLVAAQVVAAAPAGPADEMLAGITSGEAPAAVAVATGPVTGGGIGFGSRAAALTGRVEHVLDGGCAQVLVVAAAEGLWLVRTEGDGVDVRAVGTVDPTRGQATVRFDRAAAVPLGDAPAADRAVDVLRVGLAVESVGVARQALEMTVGYLRTREQFGRTIGSFQALQHRAAELAVEVEAATSTAYYAAWATADAPDELPVVAPLALSVCAEAAWHVAAETIQLHGGIGFTWEHDAHLYFKRAATTRLVLGDAPAQRRLVATRAHLAM
ncbi:MAG TPA: acyl-CoA dehydrogenase family protein [Mycobacteriales bacterium]|nr:acyl-CoA dehydrogenase family protein [Mycobacteriales bacterium]